MAERKVHAGFYYEQQPDGSWRKAAPVAPQMPADPSFPYEAPQAAANVANTQVDASVNAATAPAQITKAQADAVTAQRGASTAGLPEGFMWGADGKTAVPIPGYTRQGLSPEIRQKAIQGFSDADALSRAADELERLYAAGPGATSGFWGIKDYLPTDANKVFNDAGQQARGYVKRSLGFTGGEGNTVAESSALYDPYLPSASDRDAQIVEKIKKLRALAEDSRKKSAAVLGGIPDEQGNIRPNAMTQLRTTGGQTPGLAAAEFGATQRSVPYPEEGQREHDALVQSLLAQNGGRLDPQAYAAAASELDRKYGLQPNPEALAAWAGTINQYLDNGGKTIPTGIQPSVEDMGTVDWLRNSAVNNPIGGAAAGYFDSMSLGVPTALAGDQMDALGESQGLPMALGQIGGALTGTSLIGMGGRKLTSAIAPKLLNGGSKAQFGRNVAVDAAYGAGYGGVTEGDPVAGAALGTAGSVGGQAVGSGLGRAIGGIDLAPAVSKLRATGIPLTAGQTLGGMAKSIEDKATSLPFVGDMINARRLDGLRAFNEQAFDEAGKPIGAKVGAIGNDGTQALFDQTSNAYDSATAGVSVPLDGRFATDMADVVQRGQGLPDDFRNKLGLALNNRVNPINDAGVMTGDSYQQAVRGLKSYRAENVKPGFEQDYRDALGGGIDALTEQMKRGGGQSVVDGLDSANAAYRNAKILEDAVGRAKGGSMSGETFTFTPSQLQSAVTKSGKKYPGKTPLEDLANTGQEVLPSKVPDSGTAGRLANMAPLGLIGAGGAGGYAMDGSEGAATGAGTSAALTALLILGGTKAGQKAITSALADRPAHMASFGRKLRNKKGLFGHAALPFAMEGL